MSGKNDKSGIWYNPSRDGNIENYIARCWENMIPYCFKGIEPFLKLVNLGYVKPDLSTVRVIHRLSNIDEFYYVRDGFMLEGDPVLMHPGKPGLHNPETLLSDDASYWEIKE